MAEWWKDERRKKSNKIRDGKSLQNECLFKLNECVLRLLFYELNLNKCMDDDAELHYTHVHWTHQLCKIKVKLYWFTKFIFISN